MGQGHSRADSPVRHERSAGLLRRTDLNEGGRVYRAHGGE
jgi:hypothetical protein